MVSKIKHKVQTEGKGKSKEAAFLAAISGIQKVIAKQFDSVILKIEPIEVKVVEAIQRKHTEKFMFLFLKREVSEFYIKLEAEVNLLLVEVKEIEFGIKHLN